MVPYDMQSLIDAFPSLGERDMRWRVHARDAGEDKYQVGRVRLRAESAVLLRAPSPQGGC